MSEYDEQEFADGCMNYSEFNTGSSYLAYVKDLKLQYEAGILCGSLVQKASHQCRQFFN